MKARCTIGRSRAARETELPLHLQFPVSDIARLAAAYRPDDKERAALAAGTRIREGAYSRDNLAPILTWKVNDRGRSRPLRNSDEEIADALRTALLASTPRAAVAVLTGLSGVAVPVASAILAAIKPEEYCVLDNRGLLALGCGPLEIGPRQSMPLDMYLAYLYYCRSLACDCLISPRTLDRAFWQWSKSHTGIRHNMTFFNAGNTSIDAAHQL